MILIRKLFISILFLASIGCGKKEIQLTDNMIITSSARISKKDYKIQGNNLTDAAITIKGNDISVDFNGSILTGSKENQFPNEYKGLAIKIEGNNITVKNLKVRGYKVGLIAQNCKNLIITQSDFSYNYKQHLRSTLARENISDWLSFHDNENDNWLRYGAGVYLKNCQYAEVNNIEVTGGQNGLLLSGCNDGKFYNNNISFNSGVGLGMYRSSRNKVMNNKLDWNVRGFSYGVYNRGQDSAGILVFEQCNENVFAYNSVTHSGDGFFLWAGKQTLDTGLGGCNNNLIYDNDFSHAPTNGVEVTFSRNSIINNRIDDCDHGIWAGYSYDTKVLGNSFAKNNKSIAWEMGNHNIIKYNKFIDEKVGIWIWENRPQDIVFAKKKDVSSRDYIISENTFYRNSTPLKIDGTENIMISDNSFLTNKTSLGLDFSNSGTTFTSNKVIFQNNVPFKISEKLKINNQLSGISRKRLENSKFLSTPVPSEVSKYAPDPLKDGMDAMLYKDAVRGKKYILIDEWGPYDFRSPKLWLRENKEGKLRFEILGPSGNWKIKKVEGLKQVSKKKGSVPGFLEAALNNNISVNVYVEMEYSGKKIVDSFGNNFEPGKPYRFTYSLYKNPMEWNVKWYTFKDSANLKDKNFDTLISQKPLYTEKAKTLAYRWWGSPVKGMQEDNFVTVAESTPYFEPGEYELGLTSDNGARLYIDGKLLIDDWEPHEPEYKSTKMYLEGGHQFRIEHYDLEDFATLSLIIKPVRKKIVNRIMTQ